MPIKKYLLAVNWTHFAQNLGHGDCGSSRISKGGPKFFIGLIRHHDIEPCQYALELAFAYS